MEILEKPYTPPQPPRFNFTYDTRPYERVLTINNLNLSIGGKELIKGGNLEVVRGQKIAIVGENGAGKSSLLKEIIKKTNPAIDVGRFVTFAFYDQEMANLDGENTVLNEMWSRHVAFGQTEVRAALARAGLVPEDMDKKVKMLSGGERAKLALCVFESAHGNVLILDEPTNHLDLPARESLEKALKAFDGTILFVSHDRYFISAIADGICEIENCFLNYYAGGYDSYKEKKDALAEEKRQEEEVAQRKAYEEQKVISYRSKKDRAEEAKLKAKIKAIEADIYANEQKEKELCSHLSDTSITADYVKLNALLKEIEDIRSRTEQLYSEYEKLI
jgi:ATP-binding cassette subfamily F protein 3